MCGISCILSNNTSANIIILKSLKNLLNRGYDSTGILTLSDIDNSYDLRKFVSTESNLAFDLLDLDISNNNNNQNSIGIGHTRWATHGNKTIENAHPHLSYHHKIGLVHNGIIENFNKLKEFLISHHYKFKSETDSEVICNLIDYYYVKQKNNIYTSIINTCDMLVGTFALGILVLSDPNNLFIYRRSSPLLIGVDKLNNFNNVLITSEASGFAESDIKYYDVVPENQLVIIKKINNSILLNLNFNFNPLQIKLINNINNYSCWMEKEIMQQPESIQNIIENRISNQKILFPELDSINFSLIKNIIFLACGTSLNACYYSKYFFRDNCNFDSIQVIDGADFALEDIPHFNDPNLTKNTIIILVSQSGETRDLFKCIELIRAHDIQKNLITLGILNVENSLISKNVDFFIYLKSGNEIAVASTKVFTSSIIMMYLISIYIGNMRYFLKNEKTVEGILKIFKTKSVFENFVTKIKISENYLNLLNKSSIFVLGKNKSHVIANEASLKIKEVAYIHAEGYAISSLKHGPFGLLESGFPVIVIDTDLEHRNKISNILHELKSREAKILLITNNSLDSHHKEISDAVIEVPECCDTFNDLISIIPLQLISMKLAQKKNLNPDYPRNLAKVVTVE